MKAFVGNHLGLKYFFKINIIHHLESISHYWRNIAFKQSNCSLFKQILYIFRVIKL